MTETSEYEAGTYDNIKDPEVVESFVRELEESEAVRKHRNRSAFVDANMTYKLDHEYSENFMEHLVTDDVVTARAELEVNYTASSETYTGHISRKATELFSSSLKGENAGISQQSNPDDYVFADD